MVDSVRLVAPKSYIDHTKTSLKKCHIPPNDLEAAIDHVTWKETIKIEEVVMEKDRAAQHIYNRQQRNAGRKASPDLPDLRQDLQVKDWPCQPH